MCPAAQIYICSFSKHSLNNYSMLSPGFLGAARECIKHYSYSKLQTTHTNRKQEETGLEVWKQEAVVSMHKESGRHELYSSSTSNLLESAQKD